MEVIGGRYGGRKRPTIKAGDLNDLLTCPECHGYFREPHVVICCRATWCRDCLVRIRAKENNICPRCKEFWGLKLTQKSRHDKQLATLMAKLMPKVFEEEALHESAFWVTKLQGSPPSSPGVKRPREDKHDGGRTGSTSAAKLAANLADVAGRDVGPSLEVDDDSAPECVLVDPSISDEDDQQMRQAEICPLSALPSRVPAPPRQGCAPVVASSAQRSAELRMRHDAEPSRDSAPSICGRLPSVRGTSGNGAAVTSLDEYMTVLLKAEPCVFGAQSLSLPPLRLPALRTQRRMRVRQLLTYLCKELEAQQGVRVAESEVELLLRGSPVCAKEHNLYFLQVGIRRVETERMADGRDETGPLLFTYRRKTATTTRGHSS